MYTVHVCQTKWNYKEGKNIVAYVGEADLVGNVTYILYE